MKYEAPFSEVELMGDGLGASFGGEIPLPEVPVPAGVL